MRFTMGSGRAPGGRPNFFDDSFHVVVIRDAQDMYVLALVTQKGGSGKSTLAVGLAVAAMENSRRVALVEADPQGTIWRWEERRGEASRRVDGVSAPAYIEPVLARLEAEG